MNIDWRWEEACEHVAKDSWVMIIMPGDYRVSSGSLEGVAVDIEVNLSMLFCLGEIRSPSRKEAVLSF